MRAILLSLFVLTLGAQDQADLAHALSAPRQRIDKIDDDIVRLLNQRAAVVLDIGAIKKKFQAPAAAPGREEQVLRRVSQQARPPLTPESLRKIYATIIAEMTAMEQRESQLKK